MWPWRPPARPGSGSRHPAHPFGRPGGEVPIIQPVDFLDAAQEALTRLGAATLGGALVGVNRELRGKPAGMRTHALVSLGAALVTLSSEYLASNGTVVDGNVVSRSIQGIIAGVGFLGGGVILKTSDRGSVRHLTTAASIWVVACLGIVCGAGQWPLALIATLLTLLVLVIGGPVEGGIRQAVLRYVFRRSATSGPAYRPGTGEQAIVRKGGPPPDIDNDD
jgi:putative Mg2+ transporter-C (MgtC) family protein